jgi:hypothetical protein
VELQTVAPQNRKRKSMRLTTTGCFAFVAQTLTFSAVEYPCLEPFRGLWEQSCQHFVFHRSQQRRTNSIVGPFHNEFRRSELQP